MHFKLACDLYVYTVMLFTSMTVHTWLCSGRFSSDAIFPIPKGKNANLTNSCNYLLLMETPDGF